MAVAKAGVPFSKLNNEAEKHGLIFPPHPGEESAQMGGITACNAGVVRCAKYGVMRDFVKSMEVVLPTGEILPLGGKLLKDVPGYSLMHLFIRQRHLRNYNQSCCAPLPKTQQHSITASLL